MESATTVTLVLAGLFFSLACALLMEELIFGGFSGSSSPRAGTPPRTRLLRSESCNPHQPKEG